MLIVGCIGDGIASDTHWTNLFFSRFFRTRYAQCRNKQPYIVEIIIQIRNIKNMDLPLEKKLIKLYRISEGYLLMRVVAGR